MSVPDYSADDWQLLRVPGREEAALKLNEGLRMFRTLHKLGLPTGMLLASMKRRIGKLPRDLGATDAGPVGFCICAIALATGLDVASLWVRWSWRCAYPDDKKRHLQPPLTSGDLIQMNMISYKGVREKMGGDEAPCRRTIERMVERGEFPRPVMVSPRRVAFFEPEVDAWLEQRRCGTSKGGAA